MPDEWLGLTTGFDDIADDYDRSRGGVARARAFAAQVGQLLDRRWTVLDVGVGTGIVAVELRALGFDVFGVDVSANMLRRARVRLGARVTRSDAARLPFGDNAFRQLTAVWLLHAVTDRGAVLAEAARVLTPGGHLLVMAARGQRPDDPMGRIVSELEDAAGVPRDDGDALAPIAATCGLDFIGPRAAVAKVIRDSPARVAEGLEQGLYSATWKGSAHLVAQACARLRALPAADQVRERELIDSVLVFKRRP